MTALGFQASLFRIREWKSLSKQYSAGRQSTFIAVTSSMSKIVEQSESTICQRDRALSQAAANLAGWLARSTVGSQ